ncbi:MAG: ATP synthase F1 subunit gamma [Candidatus Omnitrophica bacterium]|nr:ATP synthase F1 subunit gamma [Candidatus Omnitrophota bacterium]
MSRIRQIKNRIQSIEQIGKIVDAMEVVALTRLKRVEKHAANLQFYFQHLVSLMRVISGNINYTAHPLLAKKKGGPGIVKIVAFSSDRGLCGGFNNAVISEFWRLMRELKDRAAKDIEVVSFGKKFLRIVRAGRQKVNFVNALSSHEPKSEIFNGLEEVAQSIFYDYVHSGLTEAYLIYNQFKAKSAGRAYVFKLLPFDLDTEEKNKASLDYIYEPAAEELLEELFFHYIVNNLHFALLQSWASEELTRMIAMKQASDSVSEEVGKLNINYHKARQASITQELIEVVNAQGQN